MYLVPFPKTISIKGASGFQQILRSFYQYSERNFILVVNASPTKNLARLVGTLHPTTLFKRSFFKKL